MHANERDSIPVYLAISPSPESRISVSELWKAIWRGKWVTFGIAFLSGLVAVAYSLSITPVFQSEAILAPSQRNEAPRASQLGDLADLTGLSLGSSGNRGNSLAILRSRNFAEGFIRDNNLLPTLFANQWDPAKGEWLASSPDTQPDIRDGVQYFVNSVRQINEDPQTGLVTLSIQWKDPEVAATWARKLVDRINEITRSRDIQEYERKLEYLRNELTQANLVELRQAISRVIEEQVSAMMLAQAELEYAFEVVDPPIVPKQRVWPKRTQIVVASTFLGALIGTFVVLIYFVFRAGHYAGAERRVQPVDSTDDGAE